MMVPGPWGNDKDISLAPLHLLLTRRGHSFPAKRLVDRRTRVSVGSSFFLGPEELYFTRKGGKGRATGKRVDILQPDPVERIPFAFL